MLKKYAIIDEEEKDMTYEEIQRELDIIMKEYDFQPIGEQNPKIKQVKAIINNTKPNKEKLFVAEGFWLNNKVVKYNLYVESFIMCKEDVRTNEAYKIVEEMAKRADNLYVVSHKVFEKLSEKDKQDGLLSISALPKHDLNTFKVQDKSVILVLDGVEIPGNIGTMVRVADGAGISAVFICNRKARLTHPKYINSSMGAALYLPVFEFENVDECYDWLKEHDFEIFLADSRAELQYYEEDFGKNTAFVLGSERYGISRVWYDKDVELIAIPMMGDCDSLNVGVAGTILMYEASIKNKLNVKR